MPTSLQEPIRLRLHGLGEICSFKNSKQITRGRKGRKAGLITNPVKKAKMDSYTQSIESQLRSILPTIVSGMGLEWQNQSLMLSLLQSGALLPLDDSRQWIPESSFSFKEVPKGMEGCEILIEKL